MKLSIDLWLERYKQVCYRVDASSLRERILLFLFVGAILWAFWYFIIAIPVLKKIQYKAAATQVVNQETLMLQTQIDTLLKAVQISKSGEASPQGKLQVQLSELNRYMNSFRQQLISPQQMNTLFRTILLQEKGLTLIDVKNLPDEPFLDNAVATESGLQFYKQKLEVSFRGDFFSTLHFLQKLRTLKQLLYWDGLTYTVETYPQAIVLIRIYTLSLTKED